MADVTLTTRAAFAPATFDAEAMTVELVWTTGARVRRVDPFAGQFDEELEVSARAIDLTRLNEGAPLLDSHDQRGLDRVLGVVERAWITGNEGRAVVRFSPRAAAIADDVQAGIIRNVSVGYSVQEWREIEAPRGGVPVRRAVRWQPHELSLVPVPADAAAQVRGAASPDAPAQHEVQHMTETTRPTLAEYETIAATTRGILGAAWASEQFRAGATLDAARDAAVDAVAAAAAERGRAPGPSGITMVNAGRSPADEMAARADAIVSRALGRAPSVAGAEQFMAASMVDHARDLLMASGARLSRYATPAEIINRSMQTTSDYQQLLTATVDRSLRVLMTADSPVRTICARREVADFRAVRAITFAGPTTLELVNEGGEVTHAPAHERLESEGGVKTYARNITLSREALVNDDLGAFAEPARLFANAVMDLEGATFAAMFAVNGGGWGPTMDGGQPLYSAAHGTVASGVAGTAGIAAGRAAMHAQTRPGGGLARAVPRHVLVGPASETNIEQALSALALASSEAERPIFSGGRLMMHVEPRLAGAPFFLFDDPGTQPVFQYLVLAGSGGFPLVESFTTPANLGTTLRLIHDFAILPAGRVGTVRVTGS